MKVQFLDLHGQYAEIKKDVDRALGRIFRKSDFILGEEERFFEEEFARYCGRRFGIGVNSGTDALILSLLGLGIGPGDEVIVPVFTFIATASSVSLSGATPVFVDVDDRTLNMDVSGIERAITGKTRAIIPVHLFGRPVDMALLFKIARKHNLKVIEDAAQAHGAEYLSLRATSPALPAGRHELRARKAGSMGDVGCFSFYPTKNLGGAGDGGMIVLDDENLYRKLLMLRDNGRTSKYEHGVIGYNSRLDTLQAAVLRIKLKQLDSWNDRRRKCARLYTELLKGIPGIRVPGEEENCRHVYHIYCLRAAHRDGLCDYLKNKGVGVMVHYPIPLHQQKAYGSLGYKPGNFPVAEKAAQEIISLPMHQSLKAAQIRYVVSLIKQYIQAGGRHAR